MARAMLIVASAACAAGLWAASAEAQNKYYMRSVAGQPWGHTSNEEAMDKVFGRGNWINTPFENQPANQVFNGNTDFVFIDGSDAGADELRNYFTTNRQLIEDWVFAGGCLFMNAAPNEGGSQNWGFGGVTLNYPGQGTQIDALQAVDPNHPIWNGPFTPVRSAFDGTGTHHAWITGGGVSNIARDANGNFPLAELAWGRGGVLFGGMTTDTWWIQQPDANNARANMIVYACEIPAPGAAGVLALGGLAAARRRRSS